jgi:hypothetical protein
LPLRRFGHHPPGAHAHAIRIRRTQEIQIGEARLDRVLAINARLACAEQAADAIARRLRRVHRWQVLRE